MKVFVQTRDNKSDYHWDVFPGKNTELSNFLARLERVSEEFNRHAGASSYDDTPCVVIKYIDNCLVAASLRMTDRIDPHSRKIRVITVTLNEANEKNNLPLMLNKLGIDSGLDCGKAVEMNDENSLPSIRFNKPGLHSLLLNLNYFISRKLSIFFGPAGKTMGKEEFDVYITSSECVYKIIPEELNVNEESMAQNEEARSGAASGMDAKNVGDRKDGFFPALVSRLGMGKPKSANSTEKYEFSVDRASGVVVFRKLINSQYTEIRLDDFKKSILLSLAESCAKY